MEENGSLCINQGGERGRDRKRRYVVYGWAFVLVLRYPLSILLKVRTGWMDGFFKVVYVNRSFSGKYNKCR